MKGPHYGKVVEQVLVRRLIKRYWWWRDSYYAQRGARRRLEQATAAEFTREAARPSSDGGKWDFRRVKFFVLQLERGVTLDPIVIMATSVFDGHHRLAAHYFARQRTIPAYYVGDIDVLKYLTGQRRSEKR
jgi:hypothetical protein